jgi:signal peptidase II
MSRGVRNWGLVLIVIGAIIAIDQFTKQWILDHFLLHESQQPIPFLSPFFQLTLSYNVGAAFGFLPQAGDLFLLIAVVVVLALLYFYPRIPDHQWLTRVATGLVCGGALGNALDRLQHGRVIDFIHYQIPGLVSNVSNLADHAIVLGVFLILIDNWRSDRAKKRLEAAATENTPATETDPDSFAPK